MKLDEGGLKEDPREKLKRMREQLAAKAAATAEKQAQAARDDR